MNKFNFLNKIKHFNYLFLLLIVVISCMMLIFINYYTIKTLSATRAYVNGESHYSKGEKNALICITNFLFTENNEHWECFVSDLKIPQGDGKARIALTKHLDYSIAKKGFIEGKNHKDDINDLIWVFENFKSLPFFRKAIKEWKQGDKLIDEINIIGAEIHEQVVSRSLSYDEKLNYLTKINDISERITINQDAFSTTLGDGTRKIKNYLLYTNIFFILLIIGSVSIYYTSMIRRLTLSKYQIEKKRKRLYLIIQDLEKVKKDLSREIVQQKKIIGTISHDIRSPLKYIALIGGYLCEETKNEPNSLTYNYANSIYKSSSQLYEFTKLLIEYSKIYMEDRDHEQESYSLYDLVNSKKEIFEEIANSNKSKIINNINKKIWITVNARIISIIIHNLMDNAVKNTFEGTIEVDAILKNNHLTLFVKDSGIGMNQDIIEYYTNLFKNEESDKLILRNYGIGLHMVLELLIILKGKIHFSSIINEGTNITIEINEVKKQT